MEASQERLNELLNAAKKQVFIQKAAVFLGTLLCQCPVIFDTKTAKGSPVPTAATDGSFIYWNPEFFISLSPESRGTILLHELWHIGFLHLVRADGREHDKWNIACDIVINNMLLEQGHTFGDFKPWFDPKYKNMTADQVYDDLVSNPPPPPSGGSFGDPGGGGDMEVPAEGLSPAEVASVVKKVQMAQASSKLVGGKDAGDLPGDVEDFIKSFYKPKINWVAELAMFAEQVMGDDLSWKRPNRRHEDIYLPSRDLEDKVIDIFCYNDCSGSVTESMLTRLTTEMRDIWERLQPDELRIINFDTKIQSETIYRQEDETEIDKIKIVGRGGTSLKCVYDHIKKHKPKLVIVFSDLYCPVMPKWEGCPILWLCIDNKSATVETGRLIHVED